MIAQISAGRDAALAFVLISVILVVTAAMLRCGAQQKPPPAAVPTGLPQ